MSEPVKLQDRLKAEFAEAPHRSARYLQQEATADPKVVDMTATAPAPLSESDATVRSVIAGAGLLFGALVLATGIAAGFYIAAAALGLAGIAGGVFLLRAHRPASGGEVTHDRSWERSETSEILSAIHDVLGDIVVMRALDGRILGANAVLTELTGETDIVGRTCEALGLTFRSQAIAHRYDVDVEAPTGKRIYSWHDVTVRDPASGDLVVHSIARDVTEERRAEDERERARLRAEEARAAK